MRRAIIQIKTMMATMCIPLISVSQGTKLDELGQTSTEAQTPTIFLAHESGASVAVRGRQVGTTTIGAHEYGCGTD